MGKQEKQTILEVVREVLGEPGQEERHGFVFFNSSCPNCHRSGCGMVDTAAGVYRCSTEKASFTVEQFRARFEVQEEGQGQSLALANPDKTKSQKLIAGGVNLVLEDAALDAIAFNEMAGRPFVRGVLPWSCTAEHRPWTNADAANFCAYVQAKHGVYKNDAERVFTIVVDRRKYNPVQDMLDALPEPQEGATRSSLLIDYLGAKDTPYNRAVTELLLNGAVMRALCPGCKFDLCVVLVGGQGIGKSTFSRALALHDEFFTDNVGNLSTKEAAENIQGRWIVEIGELASFRKKEVETIKLFLSQQFDNYRTAYDKFSEQRPRRCVFIATTNSASFLNDYTGARRFLPVRCNEQKPTKDVFDTDALSVDIAQAYAHTMALFRQNGALPLVLPAELAADALAAQEAFAAEDTKSGLIAEWLEHQDAEGNRVCVLQIMAEVFSIERDIANSGQNKAFQNDIVAIMDNNMPGWVRVNEGRKVTHSKTYGRQRCWAYTGSKPFAEVAHQRR